MIVHMPKWVAGRKVWADDWVGAQAAGYVMLY